MPTDNNNSVKKVKETKKFKPTMNVDLSAK